MDRFEINQFVAVWPTLGTDSFDQQDGWDLPGRFAIVRSFLLSGFGSAMNLAAILGRTKLLAIYLGPSGLGIIILIQQFLNTLQPLVTIGGEAPLVQGMASRTGQGRVEFASSSVTVLAALLTFFIVILMLFNQYFKTLIQASGVNYSVAMVGIPIVLLFMVLTCFTSAILSTFTAIGSLQKAQVAGSIGGLVAAILIIFAENHVNSFVLILYFCLPLLIVLLVSGFYIRHHAFAYELIKAINFRSFSIESATKYVQFGLVTTITSFFSGGVWFIIRKQVLSKFGGDALGYFSANINLSGMLISIFATALSSYYLPKYASSDVASRKALLRISFCMLFLLSIVFLFVLRFFPEFIVSLFFSQKFLPMIPVLKYWSVGDLFRILAFPFSYAVLAMGRLKAFFWAEFCFIGLHSFGLIFYIENAPAIDEIGLVYSSVNLGYLVVMFILHRCCERVTEVPPCS